MRTKPRLSCGSALVALVAFAVGGCQQSCKSDRHPYVPYAIGETSSSRETAAAAPPLEHDGGGAAFSERAAAIAPPNATEWSVDGVSLDAPPGRVFALALVDDFDGDGAADALAVVRSPDKSAPGEVVYYAGQHGKAGGVGAAEPIASPVELATDPAAARADPAACAATQRLALVGNHSAFVEIGAPCPKVDAASRFIAVLVGAKVHLAAVIHDPPSSPKLTVDADGSDFDGDGIDDVALRVALEGGSAPFDPGPKVSAILRWRDRPAGLSRDASATDASFVSLASTAMARSVRSKEASGVPAFAAQTRALFRAICPEGGATRIAEVGSGSIACGPSHALEESNFAEVRALVTMGDPLRAIAALDRAQRPPATKTASRAAEAQAWIVQAAPALLATSIRTISAVPKLDRGTSPSWGPLAFETSGKLLVRTTAGVVRVDPDEGDEMDADDVGAWPSPVVSPDGSLRWIEAYNPCDGVALRATLAPTGEEGQMRDVALPIGAPLAAHCSKKGEAASAIAIAWGGRGLEAIVAGEPVLVGPDLVHAKPLPTALDQPVAPGAPRSPDGKVLVVPTSFGVLVRAAKTRLYRAPELDGTYASQRDCAVSNDATHVACVKSNRVWVGTWEP